MPLTDERLREYAKQIISMEAKCIEWGAEAERSVELCVEELRKLLVEASIDDRRSTTDAPYDSDTGDSSSGEPKLCRLCGQPIRRKDVRKRPDEYDHAQGCPYSRKKKGA